MTDTPPLKSQIRDMVERQACEVVLLRKFTRKALEEVREDEDEIR